MGLIKGLLKTMVNVATLPIDVAKDVVNEVINPPTWLEETNIERKMDKIQDDIESIFED